jgi:hypothetical protein
MKKVRPAIYHEFSLGLGWGWVELSELSKMLGLTPVETVKKYGWLSSDAKQYNVLAAIVEGKFGNYTLDRLVGMNLIGAFVPAGWSNDVINEATGINEQRRLSRIEKEATRILKEIEKKGYSLLTWDNVDDEKEIVDQIRETVVKTANQNIGLIHAETDYTPSDEPYFSFTMVLFDANRFEKEWAYYGNSLFQTHAHLKEQGYFSVTSDRVKKDGGAAYYLRQIN